MHYLSAISLCNYYINRNLAQPWSSLWAKCKKLQVIVILIAIFIVIESPACLHNQ